MSKKIWLGMAMGTAMLAGTAYTQQAEAALVGCPASFTADGTSKVSWSGGTQSAASACQYIVPPSASTIANEATVNANEFFGIDDWEFNPGNTEQFEPPNGQSGTWSIAAADFASFDYMIVFKDGAGTNLTGFLFNEESASGTWTTPFTDPPFDLPGASTSADVSHYSIFRVSAGTPVPEPASLALLGAGLLGLALVWRRRRDA